MKTNLIGLFLCSAFAIPAASEVVNNPDWGDDRIIFGAQFNLDKAFLEGINAGGTVLSAERKCFASVAQYERGYGKGVCEKIKQFAPKMHEEESFAYHTVWHVVVPAVALSTVVWGLGAFLFYKAKIKRD